MADKPIDKTAPVYALQKAVHDQHQGRTQLLGSTAAPPHGAPQHELAVTVDPVVTAAPSEPQPTETIEQAIARIRAIRKPFAGAMSQKLALPKRNGYHRHWFNDIAGRIDEAVASGWAHVINPRDGKPTRRAVGTGRDNGVLYAYAMEIPNVFWQEEMDAKHAVAAGQIEGIKKRPAVVPPQGVAQASDAGKFYSPHDSRGLDPISVVNR